MELDHRTLEGYPHLARVYATLLGELRSSTQQQYPSCYARAYSALTALPWLHPDRTEHWDWYYPTLRRESPELAAETLQSLTDALFVAYTSPCDPLYALLDWTVTSLWAKAMEREWAMFATAEEPELVWAVCLVPAYGTDDPYHCYKAVTSSKGVTLEREDATRLLYMMQMNIDWTHHPDDTPKGPEGGKAGEVVCFQQIDSTISYVSPLGGVVYVRPWQTPSRGYSFTTRRFPWWVNVRGGLFYLKEAEEVRTFHHRTPASRERAQERARIQAMTYAPPVSRFQAEMLPHEGFQNLMGILQGVPSEALREHFYYVHEKFKSFKP